MGRDRPERQTYHPHPMCDNSTRHQEAALTLGMVLFAVYSLLAVISALPIKDNQKSILCLNFSDKALSSYSQMRCSITYSRAMCAEIRDCPSEAPLYDISLMQAWLMWKSYNKPGVAQDQAKSATDVPDNATDEAPGTVAAETTTTLAPTTTTRRVISTTRWRFIPSATTPALRRVDPDTPCLRYRRTALSQFRYMGCTVIPGIGCSIVADCPTDCQGNDGQIHKLGSNTWFEGDQMCSCDNIYHVRAFVPRTPRRGTKWPPLKNCVTFGCFLPETHEYIKPKEVITRFNGARCECKVGKDPGMQDDAPPFHLACGPVR